jgi:hypothetical protein
VLKKSEIEVAENFAEMPIQAEFQVEYARAGAGVLTNGK